jgi:hypothetical protein
LAKWQAFLRKSCEKETLRSSTDAETLRAQLDALTKQQRRAETVISKENKSFVHVPKLRGVSARCVGCSEKISNGKYRHSSEIGR